MNWLDIVILIVLAIFTLVGLWKGFVRFVLYIIGLILSIILGVKYASQVAHLLFTTPPDWAVFVSFAIILISVLLLSYFLSFIISWILSWLKLDWIDRLLGTFFALGLAVVIWGLLLTFVSQFPFFEDIIRQSVVARFIIDLLNFILPRLPRGWQSLA